MWRIALTVAMAHMLGCGGSDCDPVGTYTLYLNFGAGDCDYTSTPWIRIYTIGEKMNGRFSVTGDPNEDIEAEINTGKCRVSMSSVQIAPTEIPTETVGLAMNWTLSDAPVGDGQVAFQRSLCQIDLLVTGRMVRF